MSLSLITWYFSSIVYWVGNVRHNQTHVILLVGFECFVLLQLITCIKCYCGCFFDYVVRCFINCVPIPGVKYRCGKQRSSKLLCKIQKCVQIVACNWDWYSSCVCCSIRRPRAGQLSYHHRYLTYIYCNSCEILLVYFVVCTYHVMYFIGDYTVLYTYIFFLVVLQNISLSLWQENGIYCMGLVPSGSVCT